MVEYRSLPRSRSSLPRVGLFTLVLAAMFVFLAIREAAVLTIEYAWWSELGQLDTWVSLFTYRVAPVGIATLLAFAALWITHSRALSFAGVRKREHRIYSGIATLVLLALAWFISAATIDSWTMVRYFGSRGLPTVASAWRDSNFGRPLSFYLFDLPFYSSLRVYLLTLVVFCILLYWAAGRLWQLRNRVGDLREMRELDLSILRLSGGLESRFLRGAIAVFLVALAVKFFLGRYEMVWNDHQFMVGIDWVDAHVALPLQWFLVIAASAGAAFAISGRWMLLAVTALSLPIAFITPRLVSALYARPNEISLETPYINSHIHATRSAYGMEQTVHESEYKTEPATGVDVVKHKNLLENVRLWDWKPFHDTVTQSQALRPYYVFHDTDLDRYTIDDQYRQVLLTPRELDIRQLPGASGWINPHFIYTHGYGLALAEVSKITPEGLPVFLIKNMPPEINTPSLKISRPQIYYGEVAQEPVFVRTAQEEFDYPSGADNAKSRYDGKGGFPISSFPMRVAAALQQGDPNILLTNYLTPESRMMIHRRVLDRLQELAGFIAWDADPYLVIAKDGRLVWMIDGYTTSDAHPFSRRLEVEDLGEINYIRNSVKATIDAYDGEARLYVFDPQDPLILAYRNLFPGLFHDKAEMPVDLRAHARYPETLFRVLAEIYRTYHMLNSQAFYNKEDVWNLANYVSGQNSEPRPVSPTYVVATLPGKDKSEFMLMTTFTPQSKENLIGVMLAHCDGDQLGQITVLLLSKQELTLGPMQIGARINQDQNISKDLTLWNQQGSQVLRGQSLVLPLEHTFLYVEPIYIQATEARMPQLRKVVLALGNRLIYADTYEQALAQLSNNGEPAAGNGQTSVPSVSSTAPPGAPAAKPSAGQLASLDSVRRHFARWRDLNGQGKYVEAAKELEAIQSELQK